MGLVPGQHQKIGSQKRDRRFAGGSVQPAVAMRHYMKGRLFLPGRIHRPDPTETGVQEDIGAQAKQPKYVG